MDLLTPLLDYGVPVAEVNGWRTRGRAGAFHPAGVMAHHTAGGSLHLPHPSLGICTNGREGLAGPLCNGLVERPFVVVGGGKRVARLHLISGNRANDSGAGFSGTRLRAQRGIAVPYWQAPSPDDEDGNPWWLDVEVENNGTGEPYYDESIETLLLTHAAWCDAFGWPAAANVHHRQHSKRKGDMSLDLDLPKWVGITIYVHHNPQPPGPEPLPTTPEPWEITDVNIVQHPVNIRIGADGNGWGEAPCRAANVVGEPRYNGTAFDGTNPTKVYDRPADMAIESYDLAGKTRIEVTRAHPNTTVTFVVSEAVPT